MTLPHTLQIGGSVPYVFADFQSAAALPIAPQIDDVSCTINFETWKEAVGGQNSTSGLETSGPVGDTFSRARPALDVGALCSAYSAIFGSDPVAKALAGVSLALGRQSQDRTATFAEGLEDAVKAQLLSMIEAAHQGHCEQFFKRNEA